MTGLHAIPWRGIGVALANHLWQSSVFAAAVWLTTLLLRKNGARVRYRLWAAASLKFLFPLSLLVGLGSLLAKPHLASPTRQLAVYGALSGVSQPFSGSASSAVATTPGANHGVLALFIAWLPEELGILWFGGASIVLLVWFLRWRRLACLLHQANSVQAGREWEILRRLDPPKRLQLRCSRDLSEPGVFRVFRPVLLWPERLSERLSDEQLESILTHEIAHIRRHDNLIATIHMAVEALFWFHPMVWWIEKHIVEERECACDEAAVDSGVSAHVYAEGLLRTCRLCVESSLLCVSGVTGADLTRRVESIMSSHREKLSWSLKLAICLLALVPIMGPTALGIMRKAQASMSQVGTGALPIPTPGKHFDVATIKPNATGMPDGMGLGRNTPDSISLTDVNVLTLLTRAYSLKENAVLGGPSWIRTRKFDITAKVLPGESGAVPRLDLPGIQERIQSLLVDRFHFVGHFETRVLPVYELTVLPSGIRAPEADPNNQYADGLKTPDGHTGRGLVVVTPTRIRGQAISMKTLADILSPLVHRPVVDNTHLQEKYDINMSWRMDAQGEPVPSQPPGLPSNSAPADQPGSEQDLIFSALESHLGLRLITSHAPTKVLVIDQIETPSAD